VGKIFHAKRRLLTAGLYIAGIYRPSFHAKCEKIKTGAYFAYVALYFSIKSTHWRPIAGQYVISR